MSSLVQQSDFPLLAFYNQRRDKKKRLVYFDNAATTQKPKVVLQAIEKYYTQFNANVHRGAYDLSDRSTDLYEEARSTVAKFIRAKQDSSIVFTRNTTEAVNLVAYSYLDNLFSSFKANQLKEAVILTSQAEHHSNYLPWVRLAQRYGVRLEFIPLDQKAEFDLEQFYSLVDKYQDMIKLVALGHVSNVLGIINPVKKIIKKAHTYQIPVLLDGAQSAPHLPLDVQDLEVDFLAFSGHKIYGPMGSGVLYINPSCLDKMEPFMLGGGMITKVSLDKTIWEEPPFKLEAGTPNVAGAVGLAAALKYINKIGWSKILEHEKALTKRLVEGIRSVDAVGILGSQDLKSKCGVVSFTIKGIHPHDVAGFMNEAGIAIRAGHHCAQPLHQQLKVQSSSRVSLGIYNTVEEVDYFLQVLNDLITKFQ